MDNTIQRELWLMERLKVLFTSIADLPASEREDFSYNISAMEQALNEREIELDVENYPLPPGLKNLTSSPAYEEIIDIMNELREIDPLWLINISRDEELFKIMSRIRQGCGN